MNLTTFNYSYTTILNELKHQKLNKTSSKYIFGSKDSSHYFKPLNWKMFSQNIRSVTI